MECAIIGGTGVYEAGFSKPRNVDVKTNYGTVNLDIADFGGMQIAFLARHGKNHSRPPHLVNYRANIKALQKLGVKYVFATFTVGSCNPKIRVGDSVILTDFIDFTKSRETTFCDEKSEFVLHTDMTDPFCRDLREKFSKASGLKTEAVYGCTEGPRFETKAEIKMYAKLGADVIGMTAVPEVNLAKEVGMCYAAVGLVSNMCTGMGSSNLAEDDISAAIGKAKTKALSEFIKIFQTRLNQQNCTCKSSTLRV